MTKYPDPYDVLVPDFARAVPPLVMLTEHAGNRVPPHLNYLGIDVSEFDRHIAYDPGIEGVVRTLHRMMNIPAVLCNYSRLIIDCNRRLAHPELFWRYEDGTIIHGNQDLSEVDRIERVEGIYAPYHRAAEDMVSRARSAFPRPVVINMHSFTEMRRDEQVMRPWHVAMSTYTHDDRMMAELGGILRAAGLDVSYHEPFDPRGQHDGEHAHCDGCDQILLEVRQDLIATDQDQEKWAEVLAPALEQFISLIPVAEAVQADQSVDA